jgi:succinoglycan biosynthesis protein ExoA
MSEASKPFVSIVMPALNEESYIADAIHSITPRAADDVDYELLILDGGSTDRTISIVQELATSNARIRLISNERRTQAAAMNIAARLADPRSRYLMRADCHCTYPEGFTTRCISTLGTKRVASVVVSMRTLGRTCMQKAIAEAQNSLVGNGGSAHRMPGSSGYVDHGHHAAIDRGVFMQLGGYDEAFKHNEDAEFDTRLTRSGRKIYLDDVSIDYLPRADLGSLARQYFNFGWGRANTIVKHRAPPKLRQLMPVLIVLGCAGALVMSAFSAIFLAPVALYGGTCVAWGVVMAAQKHDRCLTASGLAAMVMHISWGVGFLGRLARLSLDRISPSQPSSGLRTSSQSGGSPLLPKA